MLYFKKFMEETGYQSFSPLGSVGFGPNFNGVIDSQWNNNTEYWQTMLRNQYDKEFLPSQASEAGSYSIPLKNTIGRITYIKYHANPIRIALEDGTELYMTRGQFDKSPLKNIKIDGNGVPLKPTKVQVDFQRNPQDKSKSLSQVHDIRVI